ncbi:hypothetical protein [Rivibacter subsaxonicus]|uniref:WD40 repeat protein n=1 Tax=Rivibacter subsaxonicus TaxID=457575 RepID=A0A4V2FSC4_9BURK|nr:hypothetical protein [Rivibacter subsaxonicus]RZT93809.1 hypothetical protein EV670_3365 [Rivibacter subsaxonicus]
MTTTVTPRSTAQPAAAWRWGVFALVLALCIAGVVGYALRAAGRGSQTSVTPVQPAAATRLAALPAALDATAARPYLLFRSTALDERHGLVGLVRLDALDEPPQVAVTLRCERVHFAVDRGICLEARRGVLTSYSAHVFDRELKVLHSQQLAGSPSRARMSPDGRLAAMTVFVSGHAYSSPGFSTRTSILDTHTGRWVVEDLESFEVLRDDKRFHATDFNFWGISFTRDGHRFYATLASGGTPFLVEGDLQTRRMRVVQRDVECPSLSPDNRHVAFKRRAAQGEAGYPGWHIGVLELDTGAIRLLKSEPHSVDDQVEWLGNDEIAYALPSDGAQPGVSTNLWAMNIGGSSAPRRLLSSAHSPSVVR